MTPILVSKVTITARLAAALRAENIWTLEELACLSRDEFRQIANVGVKTVREAEEVLSAHCLRFVTARSSTKHRLKVFRIASRLRRCASDLLAAHREVAG